MTTDGRDAAIDAELRQAVATLRAASGPDHPSEDDWARFAANEMSSDERTRLADHVVSCTECAAIFRVVTVVGESGRRADVAHRPAFGDWRVLAAAAAMVLTIGLGVWWATRTGADESRQRAGTEPPPATTPNVDAQSAPIPLWASLSSPPDVRLPPDLVLTMRGADGDRDAFLKVFGEAIAPYRAGQWTEAAAALTPVAERYSKVPEVWFYLGAARLYGGAAVEAIEPLGRAQSSGVVGDDARWLQAVALQRAGREGEARAALQTLCAAAGPNQERACAVFKP